MMIIAGTRSDSDSSHDDHDDDHDDPSEPSQWRRVRVGHRNSGSQSPRPAGGVAAAGPASDSDFGTARRLHPASVARPVVPILPFCFIKAIYPF